MKARFVGGGVGEERLYCAKTEQIPSLESSNRCSHEFNMRNRKGGKKSGPITMNAETAYGIQPHLYIPHNDQSVY